MSTTIFVDPAGRPIITDDSNEEKIRVVSGAEAQRIDLERSTCVIDGAEYTPDAEFEAAAQPRPVTPLDFTAEKDANGTPFTVRAELFEVSRDGKNYRLQRYGSKEELATRLREAETQWAHTDTNIEPPERLREAESVHRDSVIELATRRAEAEKLREGDSASGFDTGDAPGFARSGGGDAQSWGRTTYGQGADVNAEYIPLMAGPWNKQLYIQQYLEMHARCVTGDTKIPLLDGTTPTIAELVGRDEPYYVYACDGERVVPALARSARHTGHKEVLEIVLDNGESIKCTPDHPFMLRDGQYKNAGDLVVGQRLMPLYTRQARSNPKGYEQVYHPGMDLWEFTHRLVARHYDSEQFFADWSGIFHVHHKDTNRANNDPCNIEVLSPSAHTKITAHSANAATAAARKRGVPKPSGMAAKIGESNRQIWANYTPEERAQRCANMGKGLLGKQQNPDAIARGAATRKQQWDEMAPEQRAARSAAIREGQLRYWASLTQDERAKRGDARRKNTLNHKVVAVHSLGFEDVYDLTVPGYENFAVTAGVFIHNSFEAVNHNPIAKRIVHMVTDFILGRGVDHVATNSEVDEVWTEFVERTDFYNDLGDIHNDLSWAGDMMMEFYDDSPFKGATDYRMVDPSTVQDIITEPDDIQKIYYYYQQYSTASQQFTFGKVPSVEYIIRQIPFSKLLHVKINVSKYEKRGRSDLFPILGWIKRLKDLMNARVIKGQLEAAFVWDLIVNSGDANVQNAAIKLPDPYKSGSTFVHNKSIELKAVTGGIARGGDSMPDVSALINLIGLGGGIPKELLGETQRSGRSGALLASEPGTKYFERRQRLLEHKICHRVADRVLSNAIKAGILKPEDILKDARSVKRLAIKQNFVMSRSDAESALDERKEERQEQAEQAAGAQQQQVETDSQRQHELAINQQKMDHKVAMTTAKNTKTTTRTTTGGVKESLRGVVREATADDNPNSQGDKMTPEQKARIQTIIKTGKYSKELLEFMFPSIAQEDRSAKLKDLALCEAMEWVAKETAATMAAKEINISTYNFNEERARIDAESDLGMSIAHVYGQDNKHTPGTALAQDVQERDQAAEPPPETFTNVPVPPTQAGFKQVPNKGGGAPGGAGDKPNSGDSKTNKYSGPESTDPTAKSDGYSAAANHPMTSEGKAKAIKSETKNLHASLREQIRDNILREAFGPLVRREEALAKAILAPNGKAYTEEESGESELR